MNSNMINPHMADYLGGSDANAADPTKSGEGPIASPSQAQRLEVYRMALEAATQFALEGAWRDGNHRLQWTGTAASNLADHIIDWLDGSKSPEPPTTEPAASALKAAVG